MPRGSPASNNLVLKSRRADRFKGLLLNLRLVRQFIRCHGMAWNVLIDQLQADIILSDADPVRTPST